MVAAAREIRHGSGRRHHPTRATHDEDRIGRPLELVSALNKETGMVLASLTAVLHTCLHFSFFVFFGGMGFAVRSSASLHSNHIAIT